MLKLRKYLIRNVGHSKVFSLNPGHNPGHSKMFIFNNMYILVLHMPEQERPYAVLRCHLESQTSSFRTFG